jgi:hypothetical protein
MITRGHALAGIFIISGGIRPLSDLHPKQFPWSLFSLLFHLILSAFDIASFGSYNGAMSTSQTENADLRSILMELRLNFRARRMRCWNILRTRPAIFDGWLTGLSDIIVFELVESLVSHSSSKRILTAIHEVTKNDSIDSGQYAKVCAWSSAKSIWFWWARAWILKSAAWIMCMFTRGKGNMITTF